MANPETRPRSTIAGSPVFGSILCGVDGGRASLEAARQAAILARDGAALSYVAVTWETGVGATAQAALGHWRAQEGLRRVRDAARELGVAASIVEDQAQNAATRLIELAASHDLLVVGIPGHSRGGGIMIGSTASAAVHRSPVPVLVARRPPGPRDFPGSILVAVDGTPSSHAATELAARLARRHDARVALVATPDRDSEHRHAIAEDAAAILAATGTEPVILDEHGPPHRAVAAGAAELGVSLVVTGSRGLTGISALRSVSERIAHAAPCSVLVVRPRPQA